MIKTTMGLPNTCSGCGAGTLVTWWAETVDHARAGIGFCDDCAGRREEDWVRNGAIASPLSGADDETGDFGDEMGLQEPPEPEIEDLKWTGLDATWFERLRERGMGSLEAIEAATLDELMAVKGIGPAWARTLKRNAAKERESRSPHPDPLPGREGDER